MQTILCYITFSLQVDTVNMFHNSQPRWNADISVSTISQYSVECFYYYTQIINESNLSLKKDFAFSASSFEFFVSITTFVHTI